MTERNALKMALEALERPSWSHASALANINQAITAIKEALAQPEQEPVFWWNGGTQLATQKSKEWDKRTGGTTAFGCDIPLYRAPPQRTWVGLTEEEVSEIAAQGHQRWLEFARAIEAKLKEKNT